MSADQSNGTIPQNASSGPPPSPSRKRPSKTDICDSLSSMNGFHRSPPSDSASSGPPFSNNRPPIQTNNGPPSIVSNNELVEENSFVSKTSLNDTAAAENAECNYDDDDDDDDKSIMMDDELDIPTEQQMHRPSVEQGILPNGTDDLFDDFFGVEYNQEDDELHEMEQRIIDLLRKRAGTCTRGVAEGSEYFELTLDEKRNVVDLIERICKEKPCRGSDCQFGHDLLTHCIERGLDWSVPPSPLAKQILRAIFDHATDCDALRCDVPFCQFFAHREYFPEARAALRSLYSARDLFGRNSCLLSPASQENIALIQFPRFEHNEQRDIDDVDISNIGVDCGWISFQGCSYIMPPELLSTSQYPSYEHSSETWRQLRQLSARSGDCLNVLTHVSVKLTNPITVSTLYYPDQEVLEAVLREGEMSGDQVKMYARQLIEALTYLHNGGILYLYWEANGFLLTRDRQVLKLANFSVAVPQSLLDEEEELCFVIPDTLSVDTIPPEMLDGDVGPYSDVWGLGCVLHHMIYGIPLHNDRTKHKNRRESLESIRDFYKTEKMKNHELFSQVFTVDQRKEWLNADCPSKKLTVLQLLPRNNNSPACKNAGMACSSARPPMDDTG